MSLNHQNAEAVDLYKTRKAIIGDTPDILANIYDEKANIVIWHRKLKRQISEATNSLISANPKLQVSLVLSPESAETSLINALGGCQDAETLAKDISDLVDMFCCLFELKNVGLRLTALNHAMCPKFHVDRVPCRLVTTYQGIATEWLPHNLVDRSKLGSGSDGKPDETSGLLADISHIKTLTEGDVGLLKGEAWEGNENAGLVHRSPALVGDNYRLLLTLDFING